MSNLNPQAKTVPNREEEYENEDEEEALSLCDLPLDCDEPERNSNTHHHRQSSSEYAFEFSNDPNSDYMSHAEDIIHCGKLVPYKQQRHQFDYQILKSLSTDYELANFSRRYCDSLPTRSNSSASTTLKRSSRSLDRKKLRRNSSLVMKSEAADSQRRSPKGLGKSEASKPRWYELMFGSVKLPPEMDLQNIKNRQVRRSSGSMFPAADGGCGSPAIRSDRRSSWGYDLLKALSCKNHSSSVAVTASIGLVPQL